jgi:5'-3' exonuclease
MSESRLRPIFLETKGLDLQQLEAFGNDLVGYQKGIMWWLGDCARAAAAQSPDNWSQCFPEGPPDMLARCMAVAKAYPNEHDRNPLASWTIHMQNAKRPDRIERVRAHVDAGRTSDEARKADQDERKASPRWLLAVDVNYFLHRFWFSGAGVEAAIGVASWLQRTVARLKEKGLTDVACCLDSKVNHRKELTTGWEDKYKDRPPKDAELVQQLQLVRELLEGHGFACVCVDGMEADDCMASFADQFAGRITVLSQDKDMRQCLSDHCNILLDVEWTEDETSGDMMPDYKWLSAKQHTDVTGIRPDQWPDYQAIMGDPVDGIKGAPGIGQKGAADLIKEFGTVEEVIKAAKANDERIRPKKREALIEFEPKLEVTRQLVTLNTDLDLPSNTRI